MSLADVAPALCSLSRLPWQWFRFSLSEAQTEDRGPPQGCSSSLQHSEINLKTTSGSKSRIEISVSFLCF